MTKGKTVRLPVLVAASIVGFLIALSAAEAPGQHASGVRVMGRVSDKLVSHFDASGIPGARVVEYRRLEMAPGARMEGQMAMSDHVELCVVEKGGVTITTADRKRHSYKQGAVFVKPKGFQAILIVADARQGYVERYWVIKLKEH